MQFDVLLDSCQRRLHDVITGRSKLTQPLRLVGRLLYEHGDMIKLDDSPTVLGFKEKRKRVLVEYEGKEQVVEETH